MTQRTKKPALQVQTVEQLEQTMSEYAMVTAKIKELTAQKEQKLTEIRETYSPQLTVLTEQQDQREVQLHLYAETHKAELFSKKKSYDLAHGSIGFRTGTPKLKLIKGFTWSAVLNLLKKVKPEYVRTKEEPDKEGLLADRLKPEMPEVFKGIGCEVAQDETFFVELKNEEVAL